MQLGQLRYAIAVHDEGGFTKAADACHIAQSSVSQAVLALERELGVALLMHINYVQVKQLLRTFHTQQNMQT